METKPRTKPHLGNRIITRINELLHRHTRKASITNKSTNTGNVSAAQMAQLQELKNNTNVVIKKTDKGATMMIMNR